jgi:light-harvesting complex I chlorophyll a/b binding protein 4
MSNRGLNVLVPLFLLTIFGIGMLLMNRNTGSEVVDEASPVSLGAIANLGRRSVQSPELQARYSRAIENKLNAYGLSSGPMQELAIAGIETANRCGTGREVSARASLQNVMASLDSKSKSQVARMADKVSFDANSLNGVTGPMGFFDPLGFATDTPKGKMLFYREVELKHGRVCMLASVGILVAENFHPLFGGNIDVPAYLAFQQTPLEQFWPFVVIAIAIPEALSFNNYDTSDTGALWILKDDVVPGDLGYDPLGLKPKDPEGFNEMQNKELNNGRLAMIATAGMIAQELVSGEKILR